MVKNKFSITSNNDGTFLVSSLESHQDYLVSSNNFENYIDWNDIMVSAVAPEEQVEERNRSVIGIGTDGKTVNMNFWKYSLLIETPILPEGVIDIHGIFSGCSQLTTLTPFPNSIETIYCAFANCTSLQKSPNDFSIPSKVAAKA